jgi:hypothetical protein
MDCYRHSRVFLAVACCVVYCVVDFRPLLIGSVFKLIFTLVLAYLLAFVVVRSASIWRFLIIALPTLPLFFFPQSRDRRWTERSQTTIVVPNEPSLSTLFQRPPPLLSR